MDLVLIKRMFIYKVLLYYYFGSFFYYLNKNKATIFYIKYLLIIIQVKLLMKISMELHGNKFIYFKKN